MTRAAVAALALLAFVAVLFANGCRRGEAHVAECAGEVRTVRHFAGETTIRGTPQRVVALGPMAVESLMALGIRPVGITQWGSGGSNNPLLDYPEYLAGDLRGIPTLGVYTDPDLERILALAPDLIVCTDEHMMSYETFSGIAPTILLRQRNDPADPEERGWRRSLRLLGDVFERPGDAERRIAEYDAAVARARPLVRAAVGDGSVLVVRMMAKGFRVSGEAHGTTGHVLYGDLGLRPPPAADPAWDAEYVPLEQLAALDPDHILLLEGSRGLAERYLTEPLWRSLRAVRGGRVHEVPFSWIRGHGWYGKSAIVEGAVRALAGPR